MSDGLVVLVPVLRRPHRVRPLLDSLRRTTPDPYRVIFIANPFDRPERREIKAEGAEEIVLDGNYAQKINLGVELTDESLIFLGADDLDFKPGWLEAAAAKLTWRQSPAANVSVGEPYGGTEYRPGVPPAIRGAVDGIGVVGTNDLCNRRVIRGEHSTHSLVARWYAELGTIDDSSRLLHEAYRHEYVDDEFIRTAIHREAFAPAPDSIVEHLHPMVGKAPMDDLYRAQRQRMRQGRRIFNQRRHLWT